MEVNWIRFHVLNHNEKSFFGKCKFFFVMRKWRKWKIQQSRMTSTMVDRREERKDEIIPFSVIQVKKREEKCLKRIIMNVTKCNLGRLMHMQNRGKRKRWKLKETADPKQLQVNSISKSLKIFIFYLFAYKKLYNFTRDEDEGVNSKFCVFPNQTYIFSYTRNIQIPNATHVRQVFYLLVFVIFS